MAANHFSSYRCKIAPLKFVMGLFSFFFGSCSTSRPPELPAQQPLEITADNEHEGFVDLGFSLRSHETLADGSQALHASGVHRGREVGITVVLGNQWTKGSLGSDPPLITYRGTVTYRSVGAPSDALLQILDQLYGTQLRPTIIRPSTVFTGISLDGKPADLTKGPTKIKLFYESDDEDRYAELYTNIDLENGILQIHEKDPDYRSAIIRALQRE